MPVKLLYFNPGHETAILNRSPYYMAPANVVQMQNDLAFLPAWTTAPENYVLMQDLLENDFSKYLSDNILPLAKAITSDSLNTISPEITATPWGLSPQVIHFFENINTQYGTDIIVPQWNNALSHLSSRHFAKECLERLSSAIPEISESIIPVFISKLEDIEILVAKSSEKLLAKAPFSSSGRGLLWLPLSQLTRTERQILHGILKKQESVSIEKVLNKKLDFAMEFFIAEKGDISFEGYSLFKTNLKGGYSGNYLISQCNIQERICSYVDLNLLEKIKTALWKTIKEKFSNIYSGYIGVDMMIYEENGKNKLHPCVEINVRNNMGIVSLKLVQNYLHPDSIGSFHIDFNAQEKETYLIHNNMQEKHPAKFENGKLRSGYLSLCPVLQESKYRAYVFTEEK